MAKNNKSLNERQFHLAVFLMVFGCLLLLAGFIVVPTGEIHPSVLAAFGELCTMVGAILGINYASGRKVEKIKNDLINSLKSTKKQTENEDSDR